jgi:hypothetical protein
MLLKAMTTSKRSQISAAGTIIGLRALALLLP